MKTIHGNKVTAIMQVKMRAFMGKNCIIMPIFAVGFTILMRYLYGEMAGNAEVSSETMNAYALSMGLVMNVGMTGIYCTSLLLAEEKEKNTLRVLMNSSVNGVEFFLGSLIPVFLITAILNFVLIPLSGFEISGSAWLPFVVVSVTSSLTSCIIGMILGIFSKNQVSAGTVTTPVLLILLLVPIFSDYVEAMQGISEFVFTGVMMDTIAHIASGADELLSAKSVGIMAVEVIAAALLFLYFYKKNGYEKE